MLAILSPIWMTINRTARETRSRIERVFMPREPKGFRFRQKSCDVGDTQATLTESRSGQSVIIRLRRTRTSLAS